MREKERKKRGNREKERKKLNNREKRKKQWNVPVLTSESGPSNYERKRFPCFDSFDNFIQSYERLYDKLPN